MERRRDSLLRGVVDQVQPALMAQGFRLTDRGMHPEFHWIEYRASQPTQALATQETCLTLSHFTTQRSIAVDIRWYEAVAPRAVARTTEGWEYRAGTDRTARGILLASAVAEWVTAAVTQGPPP